LLRSGAYVNMMQYRFGQREKNGTMMPSAWWSNSITRVPPLRSTHLRNGNTAPTERLTLNAGAHGMLFFLE
jgi:hypothetical protein